MVDRRRSIERRLTAAIAVLVAGCSAISLGVVYWTTVGASRRAVDRSVRAELDELVDQHARGGAEHLESELEQRMGGAAEDRGFLYLYSERSRTVTGNLRSPDGAPSEVDGLDGMGTFTVREREVRASRVVMGDGRDLVVARDVTESRSQERRLLGAILVAIGAVCAVAVGAGLLLARRLLDRVRGMNRTIVSILRGDRRARVTPGEREDEFEELARHFNTLLDENERLVERTREVTDDIAHDLRTPLARLRTRVEAALVRMPRGPSGAVAAIEGAEIEALLEDVMRDTDGLLGTFQALLSIAKIESDSLRDSMQSVDLAEAVEGAVELYEPVAEEAGVVLRADAEPRTFVTGNGHLLSQALTNMIDNALKFSPEGGRVEVTCRRTPQGTELRITDEGPGIPADQRQRVLQRFVRLDASRHHPGTGLGLSLVAAVARVHGAELLLDDHGPGLAISLVFPRESAEH